ncbi:hypothetical protein CC2G_004915 [Coprinopsis cinerea AmutBmut pab1-1]|nr:hypothetical protein CC2G_004915 [Coprinopsis cinerea AmutBmut pab1-1]
MFILSPHRGATQQQHHQQQQQAFSSSSSSSPIPSPGPSYIIPCSLSRIPEALTKSLPATPSEDSSSDPRNQQLQPGQQQQRQDPTRPIPRPRPHAIHPPHPTMPTTLGNT